MLAHTVASACHQSLLITTNTAGQAVRCPSMATSVAVAGFISMQSPGSESVRRHHQHGCATRAGNARYEKFMVAHLPLLSIWLQRLGEIATHPRPPLGTPLTTRPILIQQTAARHTIPSHSTPASHTRPPLPHGEGCNRGLQQSVPSAAVAG